MTENNIFEKMVEIADGYMAFTRRDSSEWKEEVSIIDFMQFRKQAIAELSDHRVRNIKTMPVQKRPISAIEHSTKPIQFERDRIDLQTEVGEIKSTTQVGLEATEEESELALLRSLKDG